MIFLKKCMLLKYDIDLIEELKKEVNSKLELQRWTLEAKVFPLT